MVEFPGNGKMLPAGRRDAGDEAPLKIWRRTGTVGGTKVVPLMVNDKVEPTYATNSGLLLFSESIKRIAHTNARGRFKAKSTPPGVGDPGCRVAQLVRQISQDSTTLTAPGLTLGCKAVSTSGLVLVVCVVVGSTESAPG